MADVMILANVSAFVRLGSIVQEECLSASAGSGHDGKDHGVCVRPSSSVCNM